MFDLFFHEYAAWLILGMLLIITELFLMSITVLWFGLGAVIVGGIVFFAEIAFPYQLLLWAVISIILAGAWFKLLKPNIPGRGFPGTAAEKALGEAGTVVQIPAGNARGRVRFAAPILGASEWEFICDEQVRSGDRVYVKEISGNSLIVTTTKPTENH